MALKAAARLLHGMNGCHLADQMSRSILRFNKFNPFGFIWNGLLTMTTQDMVIPGFGRIMGEVEEDHMEMLVSEVKFMSGRGFTTSSPEKMEAFGFAFAKNIAEDVNGTQKISKKPSRVDGSEGRTKSMFNICTQLLRTIFFL